ncbi:substrate-binding domain-containing protein [Actinokineospora sp. HUAS TT18]|uniref:LacI family DNA-binding transcriptional regulator n=1 Tax=Actinokineospora sp. HUAS TT18 TaxID=3447451 RepID=UPI003F52595F
MVVTADERRARILELVGELGTVRVADLAERLGLPAVTVRRDVAQLAEEGRLHRSHGSVSTLSAPRALHDRVVGMLVPTASSYFDEIIAGARAAADAVGARIVLGIASYESADDENQVKQLLESDVEGLLLSPNWPADGPTVAPWLDQLPVPAVLVERRPTPASAAADLDSVSSHHAHGVLVALRHLVGLGHDSVILAARSDTWTARDIRVGYAGAVEALGLPAHPVIGVDESEMDRVADEIAAAVADGVHAALIHNDRAAIQLTALLRTRGVRIPEDLAVVSYDDVFAALSAPPLTAVAPPKRAVGQVAMELMLRRLDGGPELPVHHIALLPELKVRTSCGGRA